MLFNYQYRVLILCTFAFFTTMVARLVISPLIPAITAYFEITNTAIGIALTGMWLAYALTQFPSGILSDRFGERLIILIGVGGTSVMSLLLAIVPEFVTFIICIILLGAVTGLHYSVATALLTRTFSEDIGLAVGIHTIGSPTAGLIAPITATWIGTQYGWRAGVAIGGIISVPVFLLFTWGVQQTEPQRPNQSLCERFSFQLFSDFLMNPSIRFTISIATINTFIWQGLASFLPTFLIEYHGQSATLAGLIFSLYFIVQAAAKPLVGLLSDNYSRDGIIIVCLIMTTVGLNISIIMSGLVAIIFAILLLGIGLSWSSVVEPRFIDQLSDQELNVGFGLVRTVYLVFGSIGSIAVGFFADSFSWAFSFGILMILLSVLIVAVAVNYLLRLGY